MLTNEQITASLKKTHDAIDNMIKAGHAMIDTDVALGNRMDSLSERIDIANQRLRRIETALHKAGLLEKGHETA